GTVCVVGKMRDLILQLSKSSIYSTKPRLSLKAALHFFNKGSDNLQMTPKWQSFDMQMSLK
ncbi:hypothetical protein V6170_26770, partial [Klebsiella pneumoniae]